MGKRLAAAALLLSAAVLTRYLTLFRVKGDSMMSALMDGSLILCRKGGSLGRGDVAVFRQGEKICIKRVVGMAGDDIDIDGEGSVYVDGVMLDEPYVGEKERGACDIPLPCKVPEGCVFVMGDNRRTSIDSRCSLVGCVPQRRVIGRAAFRFSPLKRAGRVR